MARPLVRRTQQVGRTPDPPPDERPEPPTVQCRRCGGLFVPDWWDPPYRPCPTCVAVLVAELAALRESAGVMGLERLAEWCDRRVA